jgi:hypothetical protein
MTQPLSDFPRCFDPERLAHFELQAPQSRALLGSFLDSLGPELGRLSRALLGGLACCAKGEQAPSNPEMGAAMGEALEVVHRFKGLVGLFATPLVLEAVRGLEATLQDLMQARRVRAEDLEALWAQYQGLARLTEQLERQVQLAHEELSGSTG